MLAPLMNGILGSFPQTTIPVITGTSTTWYQEVRITDMLLSVSCIGSQSNALLAADLYNRIRTYFCWTGKSFSTANVNPAGSSLVLWPVMQDITEVLFDANFDLPSVSFDTTNTTNTPMVRTWRGRIPINKTLQCFSSSATGTSGWDTKEGDLILALISDSAVTPNPTVSINARIFYDIIRR